MESILGLMFFVLIIYTIAWFARKIKNIEDIVKSLEEKIKKLSKDE